MKIISDNNFCSEFVTWGGSVVVRVILFTVMFLGSVSVSMAACNYPGYVPSDCDRGCVCVSPLILKAPSPFCEPATKEGFVIWDLMANEVPECCEEGPPPEDPILIITINCVEGVLEPDDGISWDIAGEFSFTISTNIDCSSGSKPFYARITKPGKYRVIATIDETCIKTQYIHAAWVDLDIDSDHTTDFGGPERTPFEDEIEASGPSPVSLMMNVSRLITYGNAGLVLLPTVRANAPVTFANLTTWNNAQTAVRHANDTARTLTPANGVFYYNGEPQNAHVFLQYWHFEIGSYGVSNPIWDNSFFWHEGDWEMMQVCVSEKDSSAPSVKAKWIKPFSVTASQHYQGQTLRWDPVGTAPGNRNQDYVGKTGAYRPQIYIARNTHATYFSPNMWFRFSTGAGADGLPYLASRTRANIDDRTGNTPYAYTLGYLHGHILSTWAGFWGRTGTLNHGPQGPGFSAYGTAGALKYSNPRGFNNFYLKSGSNNTADPAYVP